MRKEVIKLTDEGLYPKVLDLIKSNGDIWDGLLAWNKNANKIFFQNDHWSRAYPEYKLDYTIADVDFLQKYGNTDQPDKERELLEAFTEYGRQNNCSIYDETIDSFLASIRTPAFSLQCQDGVVTDPEQMVYWYASGLGKSKARDVKEWGYQCWISPDAALTHRLYNTPAIKLSDLKINLGSRGEYYWILKEDAHNLVNERINATK